MGDRRRALERAVGEGLAVLPAAALVFFAIRANDAWIEAHTTPLYCLENPAQLARGHAERVVAAVAAAALVFVVRPRLGRYVARRGLRSFLGASLRVGLALVLAVVVADGVLRWRRARANASAHARAEEAARVATPPQGTAEDAAVDVAGRRVRYVVDADGARRPSLDAPWDHAAPTIVFSGESVAFGYGLDYDESIPARVEALTGVQTLNVAACGTATDEALFRLEHALPKVERPVAVVTFIVYDWLYRNIGLHRERLVPSRDGDGVVLVPAEPALLWSSPLFAAARELYHAEDAVPIARAVMREAAKLARARGAYPLFVVTSCGGRCMADDPSSGRPRIERRLVDDQPFATLVLDTGPDTLPYDCHPNARAAARDASAVAEALARSGALAVEAPGRPP